MILFHNVVDKIPQLAELQFYESTRTKTCYELPFWILTLHLHFNIILTNRHHISLLKDFHKLEVIVL